MRRMMLLPRRSIHKWVETKRSSLFLDLHRSDRACVTIDAAYAVSYTTIDEDNLAPRQAMPVPYFSVSVVFPVSNRRR
jgi:hypothetical protein